MSERDKYALGYRSAEMERLQRQAGQLAADSVRLFDEIGSLDGAHVLEIGCGPLGCLELLSSRVGSSGSVVGLELSQEAVALAQAHLVANNITNVEVRCGDARSTGLAPTSFDLVSARLVVVNVPMPEEIVAQAVSLCRPGGTVAFHEVDWAGMMCDPPSAQWDRLVELFLSVAEVNGNSFDVGRRLPGLLHTAGLVNLQVVPIVHFHPPGDPRRMLLLDFADNFKSRVVGLGLATDAEVEHLKEGLRTHLSDPAASVFIGPYVQVWGRKAT